MAKTIARVAGTLLSPGMSRNRRVYTAPMIAAAVADAQERIKGDGMPLTMMTHHGGEDDSTRIIGRITGMSLGEDGSAKFTADIADTEHGRTIAALADTSGGPAFLRTVSLRGAWQGRVRKIAGPDGKPAESADGLAFHGADFTKDPGVAAAQISTFSWASGGQNETTERVLITESVEAAVTFTDATEAAEGTESAPAVPEGIREALSALLPPEAPHVLENGLCATCGVDEARNKTPYGVNANYADPGYQKDGVKRYPLDTAAHIRAAYSYFSMPKNAAKYTAAQAKRIKGRIRAAMKRIGAKLSAESGGWLFSEPYQVTEAVAEYMGDPSRSGSWCINACNGPVSLSLSCYSMDPADLKACLAAAAPAVANTLAALDPDMDGDVDVPAGGSGDTDDDGGHESAPEEETPATEDEPAAAGETSPAPAGTTESEVSAMPEDTATTTEAGGTAPAGLTLEQVQEATAKAVAEAVSAALAADREARKARKAAKATPPAPAAETAAPAAPVAETDDARIARIVAEAIKATAPAAPEPVTETEDQKITRIVQEMVAGGTISPGRKGSDPAAGGTPALGGEVALNEHGLPSAWPNKPLHEYNPEEITKYCAPVVDELIFGGRVDGRGRPMQVLQIPS